MILGIIASSQTPISSSGGGGGSDFNLANFPGYVAVYESPYIDGTNKLSVGSTSASWTTISSPKRTMCTQNSNPANYPLRVLPQENTNNSPFGLSVTASGETNIGDVQYGPLVNYLQYLNQTIYITYDFRESGTSSTSTGVSLRNNVSKQNTNLYIYPRFIGGNRVYLTLNVNGSDLIQDFTSNKRSGVAAISIKYNNSTGAASFTAYHGTASTLYATGGFPLTFMTSDIPGTVFNVDKTNVDWVGAHSLVMCASVHSPATVSSNLSYLSSRYGVF
jgi:hypothetical protein